TTLERDFGSLEEFEQQFLQAAIGVFGSGWAWLVLEPSNGKLTIQPTSNADNPLVRGATPLLTCDVWEHAYYIDYRNDRAKYVKAMSGILNWEFAQRNYASEKRQVA